MTFTAEHILLFGLTVAFLLPLLFLFFKKNPQVEGNKEETGLVSILKEISNDPAESFFVKPKELNEIIIDTAETRERGGETLGKKIIIFFPDEVGISTVLVSSAVGKHRDILFERAPKELLRLRPMAAYSWYASQKECEPGGLSFSALLQRVSEEQFAWFKTTPCYARNQEEIEKRYERVT